MSSRSSREGSDDCLPRSVAGWRSFVKQWQYRLLRVGYEHGKWGARSGYRAKLVHGITGRKFVSSPHLKILPAVREVCLNMLKAANRECENLTYSYNYDGDFEWQKLPLSPLVLNDCFLAAANSGYELAIRQDEKNRRFIALSFSAQTGLLKSDTLGVCFGETPLEAAQGALAILELMLL